MHDGVQVTCPACFGDLMPANEEIAESAGAGQAVERVERYEIHQGRLLRRVLGRNGQWIDTDVGSAPARGKTPGELHALADLRYLQSKNIPKGVPEGDKVRIADLFGGIGALTLGVMEGARAVGRPAELVLAADNDPGPLSVLRKTLRVDEKVAREVDLGTVLDGEGRTRSAAEKNLLGKERGQLDVLVAGPPCQGHSSLNNHTRHDDPRNDLYGRVGRFVDLERPRLVVVENVDSVVNDQRESASQTAEKLKDIGYVVDQERVSLHHLGVAQKRRRHVLVATRAGEPTLSIKEVVAQYTVPEADIRNVKWAIGDLEDIEETSGFDAPSQASQKNRRRIEWLHEGNDRYDLPNARRPKCHRVRKADKSGKKRWHSYRSMYGKLNWNKPAQTITSGYGSMGQGRYVHPSRPRTLTPHEAARLQFIPDFVRLDAIESRGQWARMIGNVAPMKLSYVFAVEFLR
jgi:DNA (cytosine-5)-methyltransferase 1